MTDPLPAKARETGSPPADPRPDAAAPAPETVRARVHVRGFVQGIGFRLGTSYEAKLRGLVGWVRNCADDGLECALQGPRPAVEAVIAWCRQGPNGARIAEVRVEWERPTGEDTGFRVRHSV